MAGEAVRPRYRAAVQFLVLGLVVTVGGGWLVWRWSVRLDEERFHYECRRTAGMIEQKMERYEGMTARIADGVAASGNVLTNGFWSLFVGNTVAMDQNFPCVFSLAVGLRERDGPGEAMRVVRSRGIRGHAAIAVGTDLSVDGPSHPGMASALRTAFGWISAGAHEVPHETAVPMRGFWFAQPVRRLDRPGGIAWVRPGETPAESAARRGRQRSELTDGLVAVFIGAEPFLREFNQGTNALVHVQLFPTRKVGEQARALNEGDEPPASARFQQDLLTRWYGRRWTARFHSQPRLEAVSTRYWVWVAWSVGAGLSVAGSLTLGMQARAQARVETLSRRLELTLDRQAKLSRDLHDGTLQSVYGAGLGLQRVLKKLGGDDEAVRLPLEGVNRALQDVIRDLRAFIRSAEPEVEVGSDLVSAVRGVVDRMQLGTDACIRLEVQDGGVHAYPAASALHWVNIVREALSNSIRHSGAGRIDVRIGLAADGRLRLEVEDDGVGFDPACGMRAGAGMRNLAERVAELGARHGWERGREKGTKLWVEQR